MKYLIVSQKKTFFFLPAKAALLRRVRAKTQRCRKIPGLLSFDVYLSLSLFLCRHVSLGQAEGKTLPLTPIEMLYGM